MDYDIKSLIMETMLTERAVVICGIIDTFENIGYVGHLHELTEILMTADSHEQQLNALAIDTVLNEHIISLLLLYGFRLNVGVEQTTVFLDRVLTAVVDLELMEDKLVLEDALLSGVDTRSKLFNCLMTVSDLSDFELEEAIGEVSEEFLEKIESVDAPPPEYVERNDEMQVARLRSWGKLTYATNIIDFLSTVGNLGYAHATAFNLLKDQLATIADHQVLAYNIVGFVLASDAIGNLKDTALSYVEILVSDLRDQGDVGDLVVAELSGIF